MTDSPPRDWTIPSVPDEARPPARPPAPPCRCGAPGDWPAQRRDLPVQDLRDDSLGRVCQVLTDRPLMLHPCWACDHAVGAGDIVARAPGSAAADWFHRACVVHDPADLMPGDVVVVTYQRNDGTPAVARALVAATRTPAATGRQEARLHAPADLADAHRDPNDRAFYPIYSDQVGRVTDPTLIATATKEHQIA